jgi:Uma2 family endonuclease
MCGRNLCILYVMGIGALVSVEEYLRTSYSPDREFVEGRVLERNLGEKDHSRLQRALIVYLDNYRKRNLYAWPEQRVQVKADRFRIPDVCVTEGEPDEQIFTAPPLICIEILSPEDSLARLHTKVRDYVLFGVPYVWMLNPRTREAHIASLAGYTLLSSGVLRTAQPHPELAIELDELFRL